MIFRQWQQVLDESKAETRRVVKYGDMIETGDEQLWFMMRSAPRLGSMVQGGRNQIPTVVLRYKYKPYRIKWQVGRTYAVQPGRGKPAIWIPSEGALIGDPLAEYVQKAESTRATWGPKVKEWLRLKGYREARIRITEIRRERLWEISLADIKAEGIRSWSPDGMLQRLEWRALWDSINAKKGDRWSENPLTWVLTFEPAIGGES